ncbi:hypothetical protein [Rufibacter latericius]|uniref:hypothetical protein n=1 Tax=Rufibacter latericius TaxID=2487040 RepID=UPI000F62BAB2|nr:hypothetical protein [Rufibacter latericius]
MADLLDLQEPDGTDNTSGIRSDLYVTPESEFKVLKGAKTTNGHTDEVVIDGSMSLRPAKASPTCTPRWTLLSSTGSRWVSVMAAGSKAPSPSFTQTPGKRPLSSPDR